MIKFLCWLGIHLGKTTVRHEADPLKDVIAWLGPVKYLTVCRDCKKVLRVEENWDE